MVKLIIGILSICCFFFHCNFDENEVGKIRGMVKIKAAGQSFQMGSRNVWYRTPVHTVKFTYDYWMRKTEVTQQDYEELMGVNPSRFKGNTLPVERVNWCDAALYCNALSKKDGYDTLYKYTTLIGTPGDDCELIGIKINLNKKGYRLPTEAEWEYACRAGTTTGYYWGDDSADIDEYAWYKENSGNKTHPVGEKKPNTFGLYDMSGNVEEWCNDWFDYYNESLVENPTGPETGSDRVLCGGGFRNSLWNCRSASRLGYSPILRSSSNIGFRVVLCQIKK